MDNQEETNDLLIKQKSISDKEISILQSKINQLQSLLDQKDIIIDKLKTQIEKPQMSAQTASSTLCMGCMQKNNGEQICLFCGFDRATIQSDPFLPLGTELQSGNYIVGKKLSCNAEGVKYIGYSKKMNSAVIISEFLPNDICGHFTNANGKNKVTIQDGDEESLISSYAFIGCAGINSITIS